MSENRISTRVEAGAHRGEAQSDDTPDRRILTDELSTAHQASAATVKTHLHEKAVSNYGSSGRPRLRKWRLESLNREYLKPRSSGALDLLLTFLCFSLVHIAYLGSLNFTSHRILILFGALAAVFFSMSVGGLYRTDRTKRLNDELTRVVVCWGWSLAAIGLLAFLSKTAVEVSRVWVCLSMGLSLILLLGMRVCHAFVTSPTIAALRANVVLFGTIELTNKVEVQMLRSGSTIKLISKKITVPHFQYEGSAVSEPEIESLLVDELREYIENCRQDGKAVDEVWLALPSNRSATVEFVNAQLMDSSVDVYVVPDSYNERLITGEVDQIGGLRIINISEISLPSGADQFKRLFDLVIASIALVILAVPMLIIGLLVKLESPGPVLFRQMRYGVDGKEIEIFKFRSMKMHKDLDVKQATRNDHRVTRVGRLMRSTSIDELPQLLNVLGGSMSLVGPRPHAVAHNELWRHRIRGYMLRHKVRPGITGWAQVNGLRGEIDTPYEMEQRVEYDLRYIRDWSPWLDIRILAMTLFQVCRAENAY